jgi:polar amino acid transport system substrate-binding protein
MCDYYWERVSAMVSSCLLVLCLAASALFATPAWGQTTYRFSSILGLADQEIAAKIMARVFQDAGLHLEVEPMPAERARVEAVSGRMDGDLCRIASYGDFNPTMIRVPTPFATSDIALFALKARKISIKSVQDLAKYRLVIIRGVRTSRDIVDRLPNLLSVNEVTEIDQLMKFIAEGRADIGIMSDFAGLITLKRLKIESVVSMGVIDSLPLYMFLHPKNKDLLPRIDAAISARAKTGELKKWRAQYKREYLEATP